MPRRTWQHGDATLGAATSSFDGDGVRLAVAGALLTLGIALVLLWIVATRAGEDWFESTPPLDVPGSALRIVRGTGRVQDASLILEASTDGVAAAIGAVAPFVAENYPRIEWHLHSMRPPDAAFVWRTRENPRRTYSVPLPRAAHDIAPLDLAGHPDWRGTIVGVGLVVQGPFRAPLEIGGLHIPAASAGATLSSAVAQWSAFVPLKGYSVAFPFESERTHFVALAPAVALAIGFAALAALALRRWRRDLVDGRTLGLVVAIGWLILDARWQMNVAHALELVREQFDSKSTEQKWLAADDARLYLVAREIKQALPPPPVRVLILCDDNVVALRVAHFLYPHNVYAHLKYAREVPSSARGPSEGGEVRSAVRGPPVAGALRSGDYVVLFFYGDVGYDGERLVWRDGQSLPAAAILARPNLLLVRIK